MVSLAFHGACGLLVIRLLLKCQLLQLVSWKEADACWQQTHLLFQEVEAVPETPLLTLRVDFIVQNWAEWLSLAMEGNNLTCPD